MKKINLNNRKEENQRLTIMIFTEGTILTPKSWLTIYNHNSYVPIGGTVELIKSWEEQGANIIYCTSRKKKASKDMADIKKVWLCRYFLSSQRTKRKLCQYCGSFTA